jgi:hypothetical protein
LWPHGADVANTVPNLFPTRARIEAGAGLIMGDGLTRTVADVGSSVQTLSPVIRGRCRNGLPRERHKTAWTSGPRSCQPGFFVGLRFRRRFKSSRPDYVAVALHRSCTLDLRIISLPPRKIRLANSRARIHPTSLRELKNLRLRRNPSSFKIAINPVDNHKSARCRST